MKQKDLSYMEVAEQDVAVYNVNGFIGEYHVWDDKGRKYIIVNCKIIYLEEIEEI